MSGDVFEPALVEQAVAGQDAVLSTLDAAQPPEADAAGGVQKARQKLRREPFFVPKMGQMRIL